MSTNEFVEAALRRLIRARKDSADFNGGYPATEEGRTQSLYDHAALAEAYMQERQQRERDQQPPTREMFERLSIVMRCGDVLRFRDNSTMVLDLYSPRVTIDTIADLRAACLLLKINTEGIL